MSLLNTWGFAPPASWRAKRLKQQKDYNRSKIRRLGVEAANLTGHEVIKLLLEHSVSTVNLEDLSWVRGKQYGGRWNHSHQQTSIEHAANRKSITTVKVPAKNTSQECHKCGARITHNTEKRTIHCQKCKQAFDRDFNAAISIARKRPASKRESGAKPRALRVQSSEKVTSDIESKSNLTRNKT